ncbi:heme biosynthesis HemY N-terminal domain-containing protein [Pleionea litopenaei]|uniref:Heme biosynthesis HemY N-terminal domain-containing protein n=1 Tax=Pleionea litopenaei TaxID=3070815 RepID=A0AA51RRC2_9GAMM|nr:heme biosynthesis HemY N-terminal domain-containing protein [Pleionea sp. HL-JVS1]WMS86132.1 heme biosynthesis HemY N-terminal domain-containing protein [Pleionea sp. HL-JVS1]
MRLFYFLCAIVIGAVLAYIIKDQHGYVLIAWGKTTIEMRLWLGAFLLISFTIAVIFLSWILLTVKRSGRRVKRWTAQRGSQKSRGQTINGLIALTEGHWTKAEQFFQKANEKSDSRLINYILAAKAAQEQGNYKARDLYLQKASEWEPDASIAVSVTQADLQFESEQYEQALATLSQLWSQKRRHPYVLKLLAKCYVQLNDWSSLYDLLPQLKKQQIFSNEVFSSIEQECLINFIHSSANKGCEHLQTVWQQLQSDYQKREDLVECFATYLIQFGANAEAEMVLRTALKRRYSAKLIYRYGKANGRDAKSQLAFAETFKEQGARDWQCLLSLGQLSYRNELWGKANSYLEQALNLHPDLEVLRLLLDVKQHLDEPNKNILNLITQVLDRREISTTTVPLNLRLEQEKEHE